MGIGKRLKEARERSGLTQEELGRLAGVTGSAITNYEKETSHPKESVMYALMGALNVEPNYLFQDCVNVKKAPPISDEAFQVGVAYDGASEKDKATVRVVLSLPSDSKPVKEYRFATAAKDGGRRETVLTEENIAAADKAIEDLKNR